MATNQELIRELQVNAAVQAERILRHGNNLAKLELALTRLGDADARLGDAIAQVVTRVTVLENRTSEFQKALEETDRRRWAVYMALLGSFLTLGVNIVLTFWRR